MNIRKLFCIGVVAVSLAFNACSTSTVDSQVLVNEMQSDIPQYSGTPYIEVNGNVPEFTQQELDQDNFEKYSNLDDLGRCGEAFALVGEETIPTEERGAIGMVKPSGWHTVKYDCVDGKYLYNRCHLLGYQLTAENANEKNLITGTRYMNVDGMLPFENMVADYVKETGNHVLYRVTPVFEEDDLVARGVKMEAQSVEDDGEGVMFNVFCYNVQPGVSIDYATGSSRLDESETSDFSDKMTYVLNTKSRKFHFPSCASAKNISRKNKEKFVGTKEELLNQGYSPCGSCNP